MKNTTTADLCDDNQDKKIEVLSSDFKNYGGKKILKGIAKTIKLDKSNWDLIDILKNEKGKGIILIVDVQESFFGVIGDKLSLLAQEAEYEGFIVNGYVRDTNETKKFNIALYALGTCPLRNFEKTKSKRKIDLSFGNVNFKEGDYVYCDDDGIIVCSEQLI
ncbi:RraA family protein [Poseidonibacter lekithochrous]|uniref:RraA family protein n=1 Tax=Poseidonibacter TaxID=2321187 RepID=UPI001C0A1FE1|nr:MULTISPECIES: RraA family protein [Poseidonibacter]MBU3015922.1 RraA family protein [Poseidonibacter lekithochrous]MDO6829221.1 RraA family protein [Poseidonibacter sp. 1_MG-2023]